MWSKTISSGTSDYPAPSQVIETLLARLIEEDQESSWAHFEISASGSWLTKLLAQGYEPYVEIALESPEFFGMIDSRSIPGLPQLPLPEKWQRQKKKLWLVPVGDKGELTDWIDNRLKEAAGRPDYKIIGWIGG